MSDGVSDVNKLDVPAGVFYLPSLTTAGYTSLPPNDVQGGEI